MADDPILHKVRSLLAKAESTTFPEEAEALSAKAQELMTRHAIDRALVDEATATGGPGDRVVTIDAPYARSRFLLLSEVARANRCRAVWDRDGGRATIVGFAADAEATEVLYTSLAVQATAAMLASGDRPDRRTRGFRSSFLTAFATRIGERLRTAAAATAAAADRERGGEVLPVLASREVAVDDAVAQRFPGLRSIRVTAVDRAGQAAGDRAGSRATVSVGGLDGRVGDTTRGILRRVRGRRTPR